MYTDDVILISESANGLQNCLNKLSDYCETWNLCINIDKTKGMIFNKSGKAIRKYVFRYNDHVLEITNEYKYLGILYKPSGSFTKATEVLCKKAKKKKLHSAFIKH